MKKINIILMTCMFLTLFSGNSFAQNLDKKSELIRFNSRAALAKKFGKNIANQIPGYFNFRKYKLIAFKSGSVKGKKTVKLAEPKIGLYYDQPFSWGRIKVETKNRTAVISVVHNGYACSSPVPPRPDQVEKRRKRANYCHSELLKEATVEKQKLWLYAFPKKVNVTTNFIQMDPPPVARPQPLARPQ